ncbi:hypothetical protein BGW36DRAFT_453874 [Talaromyces proteolyticus]|uniref:Amine oxidase domain-containing protein n=1 Tax=Talaromyces proteolyticus TaxID=1131652 RepID=A0AAD4PTJ0_9EURO|nr:uncharacterized protein BGW36DRAFT_453874 [Talaromyces proteolyticus]KAH8693548.1 hypothetical protein BGW36DRAFT_453874 [Talaromyces proteolyticus]
MECSKSIQKTVAIIGSGPAGAFAAWALQNDGFCVILFEKVCVENHLTLNGHSYRHEGDVVSIPMRTFSGKYYANFFQVLNHLHIKTQIHRFHFLFMRDSRQYFQFFSNFHKVIPCLKNGLLLNIFTFLCYIWFTFACFWISPYIASLDTNHTKTETLEEYIHRIWLPDVFLGKYLLPLYSSVATCSHDDLRLFPAAYILNYRKETFAAQHQTVPDMGLLQDQLTENVEKRFRSEVVSVKSQEYGKVIVQYRHLDKHSTMESEFDHVILATNSAVSSKIHEASSSITKQLRSRLVRVSVHLQTETETYMAQKTKPSEILILNTEKNPQQIDITHSVHLHPSGVSVTVSAEMNNDVEDQGGALPLHIVTLARPLPTPDSHRILLSVFGEGAKLSTNGWKNGDGNVYLAGGYASAGLPLLEACARSGLEAAEAIGANLPFALIRKTPF